MARAIDKRLRSSNIKSTVHVFELRGHILDSDLKSGYECGKINPFVIFQLITRDKKSYRGLN